MLFASAKESKAAEAILNLRTEFQASLARKPFLSQRNVCLKVPVNFLRKTKLFEKVIRFHQNVEIGIRTQAVEQAEREYMKFRLDFGEALIQVLEKPFRKTRFMSDVVKKSESAAREEWKREMAVVLPPSLSVRRRGKNGEKKKRFVLSPVVGFVVLGLYCVVLCCVLCCVAL